MSDGWPARNASRSDAGGRESASLRFEIRSLPALAHRFPRGFAFHVAHPIRSIAWLDSRRPPTRRLGLEGYRRLVNSITGFAIWRSLQRNLPSGVNRPTLAEHESHASRERHFTPVPLIHDVANYMDPEFGRAVTHEPVLNPKLIQTVVRAH